jgi:hypothetical protein
MPRDKDIIREIGNLRSRTLTKPFKGEPLNVPREVALRLKYKKGDQVIDGRSGEIFTVIAGTRKSYAIHSA